MKNLNFILKNLNFILKNLNFILKNLNFILKWQNLILKCQKVLFFKYFKSKSRHFKNLLKMLKNVPVFDISKQNLVISCLCDIWKYKILNAKISKYQKTEENSMKNGEKGLKMHQCIFLGYNLNIFFLHKMILKEGGGMIKMHNILAVRPSLPTFLPFT